MAYQEDVVWALTGLGEISEVTTCSLHASLASKMQGYAQRNGIVVVHNVVAKTAQMDDLFTPVCSRTNDENDRYIFQVPEKTFNFSAITIIKRSLVTKALM